MRESLKSCESLQSEVTIHSDKTGVIRKYLNGAVCVESPLDTLPLKTTFVSKTDLTRLKRVNGCGSAVSTQSYKQTLKIKRSKSTSSSWTSMVSAQHYCCNSTSKENVNQSGIGSIDEEKQAVFRNWMLKKLKEKRSMEETRTQLLLKAEKEKEDRLEKERENFKKWLAEKKQKERMQEQEKQKQVLLEKEKEVTKKRRQLESELRYQLWLKKKEEADLERKVAKQMERIKRHSEKERRIEENQEAYNAWLKGSANKQKPVPTGKGLESLRSCISIAYKNPVPWTPNIDKIVKPSTY